MKKIFALLMAAVMTMSLLVGCGQKDEDNNTSSDDNTAGDSQYHIASSYTLPPATLWPPSSTAPRPLPRTTA